MALTSGETEILGNEIREAMRRRGMSAAALSRASGVDPGRLSRILRGDFRTKNPTVVQICNFLGISADGTRTDDPAARICASALSVWDGSSEDADRLVTLFDQIAAIRRRKP